MYFDVRQNWWLLVIRGVAALTFGTLALLWPEAVLEVLVIIFGTFFFVDGLLLSIYAFRNRLNIGSWFGMLLTGLVGIAAGGVALLWPEVTAVAFILLFAIWAIVSGLLQTMIALPLRRHINGGALWVVAGMLTLVVGLMVFFWPRASLVALTWLIGCYAIVYGFFMIWLGLRAKTTV